MNDLIEKLKDKTYVRAFGLMLPEEQACFEEARLDNCLCYAKAKWRQAYGGGTGAFGEDMTYAIKSDYQPEPELSSNRKLAIRIAEKLYTMHGAGLDGTDVLCERKVCMKLQADGSEKALGGLCLRTATNFIERLLDEELGEE